MDELIIAVNRLVDSQTGTLPLWANIVCIVVPILLTVLSIYLTVRMDRQNKKLQIALANRDMQNQTRQAVLDIYNAYCAALNYVGPVADNVASVFVSDQSYYNWAGDVQKAYAELCRACNQANLMLNDDKLMHELRSARDAYARILTEINCYIYTGIPSQTITNAWAQISKHYGVVAGNYAALMQNPVLGDAFTKACETSFTKNIQKNIKGYMDIVGCDSFDEPFRKYVQIRDMQ